MNAFSAGPPPPPYAAPPAANAFVAAPAANVFANNVDINSFWKEEVKAPFKAALKHNRYAPPTAIQAVVDSLDFMSHGVTNVVQFKNQLRKRVSLLLYFAVLNCFCGVSAAEKGEGQAPGLDTQYQGGVREASPEPSERHPRPASARPTGKPRRAARDRQEGAPRWHSAACGPPAGDLRGKLCCILYQYYHSYS